MGIPDLPQGSACNGKIDVLFAIGQGGVTEHLDVLQASYAAFAATMMETWSTIPTAVITESSENTTSTMMI